MSTTELRFDTPTGWNLTAALDAATREVNPGRPVPRFGTLPAAPATAAPVPAPMRAVAKPAGVLAARKPPSVIATEILAAEVLKLRGTIAAQAAAQAVLDRAAGEADARAAMGRQRPGQAGQIGGSAALAARDGMIRRNANR